MLTMARHLRLQGAISVVMGVPNDWLDPQVCTALQATLRD